MSKFEEVGPKRIALAALIALVAFVIAAWLVRDLAPLVEHWDIALMVLGVPGLILGKRLFKTRNAVRELEILLPARLKEGPASYRQLVRYFEEYTPQEISTAIKLLESQDTLARVGPCLCLPSALEEGV